MLQTKFIDNENEKNKPKTFREVYKQWLTEYEKNVAGSTLLKTERIFKNHILKKLGDFYISEITPIKIQELIK